MIIKSFIRSAVAHLSLHGMIKEIEGLKVKVKGRIWMAISLCRRLQHQFDGKFDSLISANRKSQSVRKLGRKSSLVCCQNVAVCTQKTGKTGPELAPYQPTYYTDCITSPIPALCRIQSMKRKVGDTENLPKLPKKPDSLYYKNTLLQ